jgi:hypothetical protein
MSKNKLCTSKINIHKSQSYDVCNEFCLNSSSRSPKKNGSVSSIIHKPEHLLWRPLVSNMVRAYGIKLTTSQKQYNRVCFYVVWY